MEATESLGDSGARGLRLQTIRGRLAVSRARLLAEDLLLLSCDEPRPFPRLGRAHAAVGAALVVDAFLAGLIAVRRDRVHTTRAHGEDVLLTQVAHAAASRRVPTVRRLVKDTGNRRTYFQVRSRLVADGLLRAVRRHRWGVISSVRYQSLETAALASTREAVQPVLFTHRPPAAAATRELLLAALVASSANLGLVGERRELDVALQRLAKTDNAMAEAIGQAIVAAYPEVPSLPVGGS